MNNSPRFSIQRNSFDMVSSPIFETEVQQRMALVEWINTIVPNFYMSVKASDEELRASLLDGDILGHILQRLRYSSIDEGDDSLSSPPPEMRKRKIQRFIAAVSEMGLPSFELSDLEKGSMRPVLDCLLALKEHSMRYYGGSPLKPDDRRRSLCVSDLRHQRANSPVSPCSDLRYQHTNSPVSPGSDLRYQRANSPVSPGSDLRYQRANSPVSPGSDLRYQRANSPVSPESPTMLLRVGIRFNDVFQMKHGFYSDLPATKISELMKSNSLDNAPTQSLMNVIYGILDESIERKNAEIPQRVACLLRKVVQEIERRIATQGEHLKTQNNLFKVREEKYQSRIRVLEALAKGTSEETEIVMNQLQHLKSEKSNAEELRDPEPQEFSFPNKQKDETNDEISRLNLELEMTKKKLEQQEAALLKKQKDDSNAEISALKQELEMANKKLERQDASNLEKQKDESNSEILALKRELEMAKKRVEEQEAFMSKKQKDEDSVEILTLKQELEMAKKTHELHYLELETEAKTVKADLEKRLRQQEQFLEDSKVKMKELEANSLSKLKSWTKKEQMYGSFMDIQWAGLQELRHSSEAIKQEMLKTQKTYLAELNQIGTKIKKLAHAAQSYHQVLNENRKLYNELQDLKGNIRVYCRVRPFRPDEDNEQTVIDTIGEHGELTIANPSRPKDPPKSFRFNKVYGFRATQAEVFTDTQPLIRTILDGYNVCIFAYGQTGSGKTYTMSGPDNASRKDWGVNYRALDDLFQISQERGNFFSYDIGVQMIEIYNEQIRDLLSSDGSQKKLGIVNAPQSHGLAVPDASMHPVTSTEDVIELMNIGLSNRSVTSTAMNERSSRSHSVVTIHVQGKDLKSGATTHGSLHLVDLAGSERVDRSEVTGDALREAQHINKSLSALGDVIFALAQKSSHVPYRNSKLTQVLQSSLGGRAKTLMFVQINPDVNSYSETLSTLKFAERVSGVELGAARSSKEGRDARELMDQVASLKDTIAKKDEEIERLQVLKDPKSPHAALKRNTSSLKIGPGSPTARSMGGSPVQSPKRGGLKSKAGSDLSNSSDNDSEGGLRSSRSMSDLKVKTRRDSPRHSKLSPTGDDDIGMGDADHDERLSEMSDGDHSVGTDDGNLEDSSDSSRQPETPEKRIANPKTPTRASQQSRLASQSGVTGAPSRLSQVRTTLRTASALKKPSSGNSSPVTPGSARRRG